MSKIFSNSVSTPIKTISTISFFRNFRLISLVFFSLLVVISCGDTTASGDEDDTPPLLVYATNITDTAYSNANNVQRNYYFLVNVTANETDKLKLVVKESSEPAPTAAEIKAGAGQTKTLSPTAKTVMFVYPIGSKIGDYKNSGLGHFPHEVTKDVKDEDGNTLVVDKLADGSLNIDGLFLKPGTAYTVYATAPDDTGAVLTGGSYTTTAFDNTKPMMDLSSTVSGVKFGLYDESLYASTLSFHADDPLFILPTVMVRLSTETGDMNIDMEQNGGTRINMDMNVNDFDSFGRGRVFFPSNYYYSTQAVPTLFDMGTGASAQKAFYGFFFFGINGSGTWIVRAQYDTDNSVTQPNTLTVNEEK